MQLLTQLKSDEKNAFLFPYIDQTIEVIEWMP